MRYTDQAHLVMNSQIYLFVKCMLSADVMRLKRTPSADLHHQKWPLDVVETRIPAIKLHTCTIRRHIIYTNTRGSNFNDYSNIITTIMKWTSVRVLYISAAKVLALRLCTATAVLPFGRTTFHHSMVYHSARMGRDHSDIIYAGVLLVRAQNTPCDAVATAARPTIIYMKMAHVGPLCVPLRLREPTRTQCIYYRPTEYNTLHILWNTNLAV